MNQKNTKISFQQRLHESFQKHRDHVALESSAGHLTYSQLETQADRIYHWLSGHNIPAESFIGVCFHDPGDIIPAIIGILKARCVFVILDTAQPRQRLLNMVRVTHCQIILGRSGDKNLLFGNGDPDDPDVHNDGIDFDGNREPAVICIDDDAFDRQERSSSPSYPGPYNREDKIYVYFTSGTTGMPRAFVGKNKSLLHFIDWEIETFRIDHTFRFSQWVTPGFDAFLRDVFTPLCAGAVICIPPRKVLDMAGHELIHWLNSRHIGLIHCVPSIFRLINIFTERNGKNERNERNEKSAAQENFKALKMVVMAGEKIIPRELTRWYEIFAERIQLVNLYGTSETTMAKTCYFLSPADAKRSIIPAGKPIPGARVLILDPNMELCPPKFVGEIYIRTPFRTHGYYNDPQANKEKFIPNPFTGDADDWLHKTGDQGRLLHDDNIEVLGRLDRQVKIRGIRVEPEEIENILAKYPGVAEVAIIDKENKLGETYLCAYFVAGQGAGERIESITGGELSEYLASQLPSYMVPAFFIPLEKMPLTPNGKVNRRALPDPQLLQGHYLAPADEMEEKLTVIWSEILGLDKDKISMGANFFRIGGHSLNATILMARIHRQLAVKIPLSEIFKNPTIRGLAHCINTATLPGNRFSEIEPVEVKEYYPLSPAQKRLYFLQQLDPSSIAYNMPMVQPLGNRIDRKELETILKKLIHRHETLRTSFIKVGDGDEPFQKVHRQVSFALEYHDLTSEEEIQHTIHSFSRPFELTQAPLMRSGLIRTANGDYIWLLDIHHIITDGTSQIILTEDFFALSQGRELAPLPLQYKDFSQWQNRLLQSGAINAQQDYWLSQFTQPAQPGGEIPRLALPTDYERPSRFTYSGTSYSFMLDRESTFKFREMGGRYGATLFMNMLAVLNVLFYKYTGQTDIIIGCGIAGRLHADLQDIVGMFVNTLPMRNHPNGEKSYEYFLKEVAANSIHGFENQEVQFEDLVEKLNIQRDLSRNPLFDILMVVQNFREAPEIKEARRSANAGDKPSSPPYKRATAKFDLTFFVNEMEDNNVQVIIEYYTGIFKEETVRRLAAHFKAVIENIIKTPAIILDDITIISEAEKQQIVQKFNDTARDYPANKTIQQLFAQQVEKTPDHIALVGAGEGEEKKRRREEEKHLTYKELNDRTGRLAGYLIEKGVRADHVVALMGTRSIETIAAVLGILKAGGAYLPIDPEYPQERIDYMLKDSNAKILINKSPSEIRNPKFETNPNDQNTNIPNKNFETIFVLNLDHLNFEFVSNFDIRASNLNSSNLAYIIYTSGSTGRPKGVMVEHRNVVRLVKNTDYIDFRVGDRLLQTGALEFDASTFEIWGSLLNGLTLYLETRENLLNTFKLKNTITKNHITIMWLTSQLFNQVVQTDGDVFRGIRYLLVGGDVLSPGHIQQVRRSFPGLRIINGYGPTENTTFSTTFLIDKEYRDTIPIGKPIANSTAYIVDKHHHLQPIGIAGELLVGGDGTARGYLNNPELTAEKFIFSPNFLTSSLPNFPLYRTGDLSKWVADGNIEFLGRIDQQVKIRGFRIELGEIENRLAGHKTVRGVVVIVDQSPDGDKYLCAYIVPMEPGAFKEDPLRDYLAGQLPGHMIPTYWVSLEKIPLTANGKLDRRALPKPGYTSNTIFEPPANETENIIAAIWSDILGIENNKIGVHDNFFRLGGHSLKASAAIARIHKALNIKIPLAEMFKRQTIREMAGYIRELDNIKFDGLEPVEKRQYYHSSAPQKRLFGLLQMLPDNVVYNIPQAFILEGKLDKNKLEQVFQQLVARHESLRTTFREVNGVVMQIIHDRVDFAIEYEDITGKDSEAEQRLTREFVRPFNLAAAPLMRVRLVKIAGERHILMMDLYHIITDGTSQGLLVKEFMDLYSDKELSPIRVQFKDYMQWMNNRETGEQDPQQEAYWLDIFKGDVPVLALPYDYPPPATRDFNGGQLSIKLDREITLGIKQLGAAHGATLFMALLALFNILLAKVCRQDDIVVGTPTAGRKHADLEPIVALFIKSLALRNNPSGEKTFSTFLKEVAQRSLGAFDNPDYPVEELVKKVNENSTTNRSHMFNAMIVLQNMYLPALEIPGLKLRPYSLGHQVAKYDLTFICSEYDDCVYGTFQYPTARFKEETIRRISETFKHIAAAVIKNPEQPLAQITVD